MLPQLFACQYLVQHIQPGTGPVVALAVRGMLHLLRPARSQGDVVLQYARFFQRGKEKTRLGEIDLPRLLVDEVVDIGQEVLPIADMQRRERSQPHRKVFVFHNSDR